MAVPNTNTFSLQEVALEIFGYTSGVSLSDCFLWATGNLFDPTYSGSKNSLLNFRNYAANVDISFDLNAPLGSATISLHGNGSYTIEYSPEELPYTDIIEAVVYDSIGTVLSTETVVAAGVTSASGTLGTWLYSNYHVHFNVVAPY